MDSLTQIVLGAAVGEATLGRKIGNRAMVWGGIAGTLPDLDVLANAVSDPMSALVYHRAFTHSLPFAFLAAPVIGYAVYRMHAGPPGGKGKTYLLSILAFWLLLLAGSYAMSIEVVADRILSDKKCRAPPSMTPVTKNKFSWEGWKNGAA